MSSEQEPNTSLFRKKAMENISSPEQLDELLTIVDIRAWIAFIGLALLILFGLLWVVFGSIGEVLEGRGYIVKASGVMNIVSTGNGTITALLVNNGDKVTKGQPVALFAKSESAGNVGLHSNDLALVKMAYDELIKYHSQDNLVHTNSTVQNEISIKEEIKREKEIVTRVGEKLLEQERLLQESYQIRSYFDGNIVELKVHVGSLISPGLPIATVELSNDKKLVFGCVPSSKSKEIKVGMIVEIAPSIVTREENGYMLGRVRYVSDYPISVSGIKSMLDLDEIVHSLTQNSKEPAFFVVVDLIEDPNSFSKYKWSSGKGPKIEIKSGTLCKINIVLRKQRPINLVIPRLKDFIGI